MNNSWRRRWQAKLCAMLLGVSTVSAGDDFLYGYLAAQANQYPDAIAAWWRAAQAGEPNALFMLGTVYHGGIVTQANETLAVKLYHRAAEQGHHLAQEYLAIAYQEGWFGLSQDDGKAAFWRRQLDAQRF